MRLSPKGSANATPYVVFTGGEPLLQLDTPLIDKLHQQGFEVAVETNGTLRPLPALIGYALAPKVVISLVITQGNELKLVYPQADALPPVFEDLAFTHFFLQPMDVSPLGQQSDTIAQATDYCMANPQWRLTLQIPQNRRV